MKRNYLKYAENYYLDLSECSLNNKDMDDCINEFNGTLISKLITHINVKYNNIKEFSINKLNNTFPNIKIIIISDETTFIDDTLGKTIQILNEN